MIASVLWPTPDVVIVSNRLSANQRAALMSSQGSEQQIDPGGQPEACQVDGIEPFITPLERSRCPKVASFSRDEQPPRDSDVDAAKDVDARGPPARRERVAEDSALRAEHVDEIAVLLKAVPEHAAAAADPGYDPSRYPRQT